ncbi:general secretion pathway protein K [Janthinobacterium sp. HH01]|uniref:type II secretion system minor pseudopilin GspK n=1 Tax=Janthinobacterium sp. HH01 TaxID=1198452 RepID=UPI0002AEDA60|nr:type II secretion system minor pseudopilin GspK [Janthinobacterium sp. HH01]ELX11964.1 general secretion pathway protein K [Janthinobacterium sp. HH01]
MRRRQRGVAVVTALLLTTLAVTIVASLFWQQQVQVRSMENQRLQLQTRWIVRGALDLSRLVLYQDHLDSQLVTQAGGIWAMPLEETRLDDYIERERAEAENFNATLSGKMIDAQSRYNLANLALNGKPKPEEVTVFERLLTNLRLDPSLAQAVAKLVADAQSVQPPQQGGQPPPPSVPAKVISLLRVEDLLAVSGFTPKTIEQLRDFVIILPVRGTKLNVNTVPAELMSAMIDKLSVSEAAAMVNARKRVYYRDTQTFLSSSQLTAASLKPMVDYDVKSSYFLAYSRVRLDRAALDTQSLLERAGNGITTVVWIREN